MTQRCEWDFPPTIGRRRQPRVVEILPPEPEQERPQVRITVSRHRSGMPPWIWLAVACIVIVLLWRAKLGLLLLVAIAPGFFGMLLVAAVILLAADLWHRRRGRPF